MRQIKGSQVIIACGVTTSEAGVKKIVVSLYYKKHLKDFQAHTTDMAGYYAAMKLQGIQKRRALYALISKQVKNEVDEWMSSINQINS